MSRRIRLITWLLAMLVLPSLSNAAIQLNRFATDSYQKILELHQGDAFLMVLWSLDCPPCIDELVTLSQFHRQYPGARIVLVSTDSLAQKNEINHLMSQHKLDDVQHWVFDDDSAQAIRYAIDPLWYGELPRSYFHSFEQKRQVRSGRLDERILQAWYNSIDK